MKLIAYMVCVGLLIVGCRNSDRSTEKNRDSTITDSLQLRDTSYLDSGYVYLHMIPDSLKTAEDYELIEKIKTLPRYLVEENGEVVFTLTREEVLNMGIPEQYYKLVQKDVININKMIKEENIKNVDSILKQYPY